MKKNKALTAALSVFALTMMSMCAIGGTFAKYVTTGSDQDTARVAKWGVDVAVSAKEAFTTSYGSTVVANTELNYDDTAGADDVLAPGTDGTLATVSISGTPEVSTSVSVVVNLELTGWDAWNPLVITVGTEVFEGYDYAQVDDFETAVENQIKTELITTHTPNQSVADALTVSWEWAIETVTTDSPDPEVIAQNKKENNAKDTALGDAATLPTLSFSLEVTVEQVD